MARSVPQRELKHGSSKRSFSMSVHHRRKRKRIDKQINTKLLSTLQFHGGRSEQSRDAQETDRSHSNANKASREAKRLKRQDRQSEAETKASMRVELDIHVFSFTAHEKCLGVLGFFYLIRWL